MGLLFIEYVEGSSAGFEVDAVHLVQILLPVCDNEIACGHERATHQDRLPVSLGAICLMVAMGIDRSERNSN